MEITRSTRNVPTRAGLHPVVYGILAGCVAWMVAVAWFFFAVEAYPALQIAVVAFFAAAFLGIPFFLARVSRANAEPGSFREWLDSDLQVGDHVMSARTALTMILCAPVAGAAGLSIIGLVARLASTGAI